MAPHPLKGLSLEETNLARDVVLSLHKNTVIDFREIFLREPDKEILSKYLDLEHAGSALGDRPTPPRLAKCQYDVIGSDRVPEYHEAIVDLNEKKRIQHEVVGKEHHASLTTYVKLSS